MWFTDTNKYTYSIITFIFQYILTLSIVITSNFKICVALNKLPSIYTYRFRIQKNNLSEPSSHIIRFKTKNERASINRPPAVRYSSNRQVGSNQDNMANDMITENSTSLVGHTDGTMVAGGDKSSEGQLDFKVQRRNSGTAVDGNLIVRDHERFLRSRQLLKVVCLSFALCWLPLLLFNLVLDFYDSKLEQDLIPPLFLTSHLIATLSCIINPIIYGLYNTTFKEEICNIICCDRGKDQDRARLGDNQRNHGSQIA